MQQTFRIMRGAWGVEQREKGLDSAEAAGADGARWGDEETGRSRGHRDTGVDDASYWLPDGQAMRLMCKMPLDLFF